MGHNGYANFYLTDQVDSVKLVTDNDGTAITRFEYLPYGESWFTEGKQKTAPKYNSQELDKETGYYYYNARHYDPEIARFVTADSIIDGVYDTQGWNRYSYVKGNPVRYSDPTGMARDKKSKSGANKKSKKSSKRTRNKKSKNKKDVKKDIEGKLDNAKGVSKSKASSIANKAISEAKKSIKTAIDETKKGIETIANKTVEGVKQSVETAVSETTKSIETIAKKTVEGVKQSTKAAVDGVKESIDAVKTETKKSYEAVKEAPGQAALGASEGFAKGYTGADYGGPSYSRAQEVGRNAGEVVGSIASWL